MHSFRVHPQYQVTGHHTSAHPLPYLADKGLGAVECRDQWVHEHVQVGQERAKAHGHSKTEFNKQVLHVLLVDAALQTVEALQEARQQGKELLVQQLMAPCGGRGGEGRGGEGGS